MNARALIHSVQESLEGPAVSAPQPLSAVELLDLSGFPIDLPGLLRQLEDSYIAAALERSGGNKKAAAKMLGLQRTTLVEKLRRREKASAPQGQAAADQRL